jgi:hypothetical protein
LTRGSSGGSCQPASRRSQLPRREAQPAARCSRARTQLDLRALRALSEHTITYSAPAGPRTAAYVNAEATDRTPHVPKHQQWPLVREVKRAERRERADHATADVSAAAEVRHIEADCASRCEHNTPADRDQTYPAQRE